MTNPLNVGGPLYSTFGLALRIFILRSCGAPPLCGIVAFGQPQVSFSVLLTMDECVAIKVIKSIENHVDHFFRISLGAVNSLGFWEFDEVLLI